MAALVLVIGEWPMSFGSNLIGVWKIMQSVYGYKSMLLLTRCDPIKFSLWLSIFGWISIEECSFSASFIVLAWDVSPDLIFPATEIDPLLSYCLIAEIHGVFVPELANEVAEGLFTGFMILLWS